MVKEIHSLGGNVSGLVPSQVMERLNDGKNSEIEFKDIIEGRKKFDIVDKLEDLRSKLEIL